MFLFIPNTIVVRYHVMLGELKKQAKKENKKKVAKEAAKAYELMYNLAKHINVYTEDYNHILMLMELKDEMDRFTVKGKPERSLHPKDPYLSHFICGGFIFTGTSHCITVYNHFLLKEWMNLSINIEDSFLKFPILKSKSEKKISNHFICTSSRDISWLSRPRRSSRS